MGFEYNFRIRNEDLANLARSPDGVTDLDSLLRSAPFFVTSSASTYQYSETPGDEHRWPSTIVVDASGFCLCIYGREANSPDLLLMNYLIHELLRRCGHVEVEEA